MYVLILSTLMGLACTCYGFSHGAPDFSCKDPSTFHTRKINVTHEGIIMPQPATSSPYRIRTDRASFQPGDRVTVTLYSSTPERPLRGFYIQAIQADIHIRDLRREAFGRFENLTMNERPSICQQTYRSTTGGATHSNTRGRASVSVVWVAPETYNPGNVQFLATGVFNYDTYWTNIRSDHLVPTGYQTAADTTIHPTATAAWYRWLMYLHQQQQQSRKKETPRKLGGTVLEIKLDGTKTPKITKSTNHSHTTKSTTNKKAVNHKHELTTEKTKSNTGNETSTVDVLAGLTLDGLDGNRDHELTIHDHGHPDHDHSIHHAPVQA
ncbi:uncharacterized protein LOC128245507 [Mya arenaria]|uniref:uncharacterized protein LOC128245507 n=1 Tax=Mya arenaria TaxID=6604 RepID=UPI0022E9313A|nr:uncharacterized protein LOC128245507 [Mya arenaria]